MTNPAQTAESLVADLDRCLEVLPLVQNRRRELTEARNLARALAVELRHFDSTHVPLELRAANSGSTVANEIWANANAGVLRPGDSSFERLVTASAPLQKLFLNGFDITSIEKFSSADLSLANLVGANIEDLTQPWLRTNKTKPGSLVMTFRGRQLKAMLRLVELLNRLGLGEGHSLRHPNYRDKKSSDWIGVTPKRARQMHENTRFRISLRTTDEFRRRAPFLDGDWLNGFAYSVMSDHLRRHAIDHELYTNVSYTAAPDLMKLGGEFDLLAQAGDTLAVVECKAGRLDIERGDLDQVCSKTDALQKILDRMGCDLELRSFLLINPASSPRDEIESALEGTGVIAIAPGELRQTVESVFVR